ncbi:hypothetical protein Q8A73_024029 [Channa argus]|nr:hypothetical protein Q8A73_024029 [Channa argus]
MAPSVADVFARSALECRLFLLFCVFLVFSAVHKCHGLLTFNRQALLDIANSQHTDFASFIPLELQLIVRSQSHHRNHPGGHEAPGSSELADPRKALRRRRRKRSKRGGLRARLKACASRPPLPSLLLANVRSLENKLDELRARITTQREIRECCTLIFTETWLSDKVPEDAIQLQTHFAHRGDRMAASGKAKGGGVCVFVNNSWCGDIQTADEHCSPDVEFLLLKCRPYYLLREFTAVFFAAVYIPPRANSTAALSKLHDVISALEMAHPDAVFIVAGDFNQCSLRTVFPKYNQHVDIPTRDKNTLDHVYSNIRGAYRAAPRPHFGHSDHISLFLSGNETEYKAAKYGLRKAITAAKRQYREKLDSFYSTTDSGRMWQGLQHITDYRTNTTNITTSTDSLPDDLNTFYTRFEGPSYTAERGPTHLDHSTPSPPPTVSTTQVHKALRKINPRKAAGPDNIPGWALRACANELADVLTSIFNLSLSQCTVPLCFKTTTIVPLPKKSPPTCLNDYRPVALTPIIMKCFERVVLAHIQSSIPDTVDPLQYAYRPNRSTSDAIAAAIHYSLSHLENKDSYLRILFINYSSAFNTVIPHKLTHKLSTLGLHPTLCDWLLDFLTGRPHSVRIGNRTSARLITNIGNPQGCVLSPILYTLFTHDCVASHKDNIILKFADDTAVIGRIAGGNEAAYRREVASLVSWCGDNNLTLNTDKTKEMIVDM